MPRSRPSNSNWNRLSKRGPSPESRNRLWESNREYSALADNFRRWPENAARPVGISVEGETATNPGRAATA